MHYSSLFHEDGHETFFLNGKPLNKFQAYELKKRGIVFEDVTVYRKLKSLTIDSNGFCPSNHVLIKDNQLFKYYYQGQRINPRYIPLEFHEKIQQYQLENGIYAFYGDVCLPLRFIRPHDWLEELGIFNRNNWLTWIKLNHPDRNPKVDRELFTAVRLEKSRFEKVS